MKYRVRLVLKETSVYEVEAESREDALMQAALAGGFDTDLGVKLYSRAKRFTWKSAEKRA